MPLAVGTVVLVSYKVSFQQQRYLLTTTWTVLLSTSTQNTATDTNDIAVSFAVGGAGTFATRYRNALGTNCTVDSVVAQPISPVRLVKREVVMGVPGTGSGTASTGNLAGVISLLTDKAGRSQIANKHIGPVPSGDIVLGKISAAYTLVLIDLLTSLRTARVVNLSDANSLTLGAAIFHKATGGVDAVTSGLISDRVGTMRRRTLRVGE